MPHTQVGGLLGAVSLSSGKFVRSLCDKFDALTFEAFLKKLLRQYRCVLSLRFLPPYSPQLAPIERVWKLARRLATHNQFFATLGELLTTVESCFDLWRKPNPVLRRLCGII